MKLSGGEKGEVLERLAELRELAETLSWADLRDGEWLTTLVSEVTARHAHEVSPEHFARSFPGRSEEEIIERLVADARRGAALEGALSSAGYTAAVAAAIGAGPAAVPITLSAGAVAFVTDLLYLTSLQLRLAYDISVLVGFPVDLDDEDEVDDLLRVAFGVKPEGGQEHRAAERGVAAGFRSVTSGAVEASRRAASMAGRRLLHRTLVKLTVPAAGIPLSAAMNYLSAGQTATTARKIYGARARARHAAPRLVAAGRSDPRLLLETIWTVAMADRTTVVEESWLFEEVARLLRRRCLGPEVDAALSGLRSLKTRAVLRSLTASSPVQRAALYDAAVETAAMDGRIGHREGFLLWRMARACRLTFDREALACRAAAPTF